MSRHPDTRLGLGALVAAGLLASAGPALAATGHDGHGGRVVPDLALGAAVLFGLLGSTHCLGMCGPLVSLYASQLGPGPAAAARRQHLLFNLGRALAYTHLGVLFGAVGFGLRVRPWIGALVGLAAGLFVIAMGSRLLGVGGVVAAWPDRLLARPTRALAGVWRRYVALARSPGIVFLGALHGLLPCPLLYVMLTSAVALGDPIGGGILLLSFSLGTVPMLWGVAALGQRLGTPGRLAWHRAFGWTVTAWGLVLVVRGLQDLGVF
jgi:uncharacterized protein